jgi:hypothetical protein
MFFDNRDDLSELLHDLNVEFKESGEKKFAIRQISLTRG